MLATWMRDVYRRADAADLRRAIDDLTCPADYFYFASNGVYLFFNPSTLDVLYIGLARDLSVRFAQHNGLIQMSERGCKRKKIEAWFDSQDELGYAMFVASSVGQVSVGRQAGTMSEAFWDEETNTFYDYPEEGLAEIADMEGILIGAYLAQHGALPPWNKIGGAKVANHRITSGGYSLLDTATGRCDSLLVARRTIRGLSADPTAAEHEMTLHTGRIGAIEDTMGVGIDTPQIWNSLVARAHNRLWEPTGLLTAAERLVQSRYPLEVPPPPATQDTPGRMRRFPGQSEPASQYGGDGPEPSWHLMWTDAGVALLEQGDMVKLFCRACAKPATIAQDVADGSPPIYWCTPDAATRGAPEAMVASARE